MKHILGNTQSVDSSISSSKLELSTSEDSSDAELDLLIKEYKTKLERSVASCQELRENNSKLKNENLKLKSILQKEIGDDTLLEEIISCGGTKEGYRGRAQQILVLKSTIKELRRQFDEFKRSSKSDTDSDLGSSTNLSNTSEDRQRITIEKMEKERRLEILDLRRQVSEKEEEALSIKKLLEAKTARNITLEKANFELKSKLERVLKKTENDDKLIDALKTELQSLKRGVQCETSPVLSHGTKSELDLIRNYDAQVATLKKQIEQLNQNLSLKNEEILQLRQEIEIVCKQQLDSDSTESDALGNKETHVKLSVTKLELESMKALYNSSVKRIKELEVTNKDLLEKISIFKTKAADLEKKQQKQLSKTLKHSPLEEQDMKIQLEQLKSKIELLSDDNNALKQTLDYTQANKDEEAKIYLDLLSKQKQQFQAFIEDVREELDEAKNQQEIAHSFNNEANDDLLEENQQLQQKIDRLNSELVDLKSRYNTVALQLQNVTRNEGNR